jgi:hypothetical protein
MPHRKLLEIRQGLIYRETKLSDALLMVLRCLRSKIEERRLLWLNRELLGYHEEDLALFDERPKSVFSNLIFWAKKDELSAPQYRFLMGTWGNVDRDGRFMPRPIPRFDRKHVFCNIGVQQLEVRLDELRAAGVTFFNLAIDPPTGADYFCQTSELVRINESVRERLCLFIGTVVQDLELKASES